MCERILVLDFGGKSNQLIAKQVRACRVYAEIRPFSKVDAQGIAAQGYRGVIFSGENIPERAAYRDALYAGKLPFLENERDEMSDVACKAFLYEQCGCKGDWVMSSFVEQMIAKYKEELAGKKVLCALSGGVDSSVSAVLLHKAIGKNLTCVFVDHGLMRKNEGDEVERIFKQMFDMNLIRVNAEDRYLAKLKGVTDPEKKRKIIGEEFIRVFEEEAKKLGQMDYLMQGTIYPDIIESGINDKGPIKSHHNVGGLPKNIGFTGLVEPLRELFKDEVRAVGKELGIPETLVMRQPFPGPGLGVRCIGEINKPKLDILRECDAIFREEIANAGLTGEINQYFAIITDLQSVGVRNEERSYDRVVALRAVTTNDFMVADWAKIPFPVLAKASERITAEVAGVNRVVYDITAKPPGTVEWE